MGWTRLRQAYAGRARVAASVVGMLVVFGAVLRVALYAAFHDGGFSIAALALVLVSGLAYDLAVSVLLLLPLLLALACLRIGPLGTRWARGLLFTIVGGFVTFQSFVEYFYFDEFNARFNHIALDYLLHPHEVFVNIWDSYDVPLVVLASALTGFAAALPALRFTRGARFDPLPWAARWRGVLSVLSLALVASAGLEVFPSSVSGDRITSEIAENGISSLVHAFRTENLNFDVYYRTLPRPEARRRAAAVLGFPEPEGIDAEPGSFRLARPVAGGAAGRPERPWDVVIVVEESLGSEFIGVLGHADRRTSPGFDRWSREGLLLTNLVANGNRTVRGLEGILCSFVPLPGDAVLKRPLDAPVATLADVFRRVGYRTTFIYGGWGVFDSMKPFFLANGYDEFLERDSLPEDAFATIWGVADEYAFDLLLRRQVDSRREGRPLFATLMSVSNHKPYDVPERGTHWPASGRNREAAVAYADWAIADYLEKSRKAGLLDHTLVLIVGDHGARVYGAEEIPAASYRIPALFLVPGEEWKGRRIGRLASQIDLAPTIMDLVGLESDAPFLGESLLGLPEAGGRAFVHHNRDFGLLTDTRLVTLGLKRDVECYTRPDRNSDTFSHVRCDEEPEFAALRDDATAVFETAYELVSNGRYNLPR